MRIDMLIAAAECMRRLAPFDPRLTGLLATEADPPLGEPVHIVTVAEHADAVGGHLDALGIPTRMVERKIEVPRSASIRLPGFAFLAGEIELRIWVMSEGQSRQRLKFLSDPESYPRLTLKAVEARLLKTQAARRSIGTDGGGA